MTYLAITKRDQTPPEVIEAELSERKPLSKRSDGPLEVAPEKA